jgi:EamA domain-containing membrane protein RarD
MDEGKDEKGRCTLIPMSVCFQPSENSLLIFATDFYALKIILLSNQATQSKTIEFSELVVEQYCSCTLVFVINVFKTDEMIPLDDRMINEKGIGRN